MSTFNDISNNLENNTKDLKNKPYSIFKSFIILLIFFIIICTLLLPLLILCLKIIDGYNIWIILSYFSVSIFLYILILNVIYLINIKNNI